MPDAMDVVQEANEQHAARALQLHAGRVVPVGRSVCAIEECGGTIGDARRVLGAQLCLPCKKAEEARVSHFTNWGRR
jgi:RNA polymerase-binding transcription factor DksA